MAETPPTPDEPASPPGEDAGPDQLPDPRLLRRAMHRLARQARTIAELQGQLARLAEENAQVVEELEQMLQNRQPAGGSLLKPLSALSGRLVEVSQTLLERLLMYSVEGGESAGPETPEAAVSHHDRERQARSQSTPPEQLQELAGDPNSSIRLAVARNPRAPVELLEQLSADVDLLVRAAVAAHPATPGDTLTSLAGSGDTLVRIRVAYNSQTPEPTLARLAKDPEPKVRIAVARNGATTDAILYVLRHDADEVVREATEDVIEAARLARDQTPVSIRIIEQAEAGPPPGG